MAIATTTTKYGTSYEHPDGIEEEKYYELMYELVDFVQAKELTIRQAQKLFADCSDVMLDIPMSNNESVDGDFGGDLKSIAESLEKIANMGINTFNQSFSTN